MPHPLMDKAFDEPDYLRITPAYSVYAVRSMYSVFVDPILDRYLAPSLSKDEHIHSDIGSNFRLVVVS
jgi:hypothetical protein